MFISMFLMILLINTIIVDKYNNSSIKMKPKDVTDKSFVEYLEES